MLLKTYLDMFKKSDKNMWIFNADKNDQDVTEIRIKTKRDNIFAGHDMYASMCFLHVNNCKVEISYDKIMVAIMMKDGVYYLLAYNGSFTIQESLYDIKSLEIVDHCNDVVSDKLTNVSEIIKKLTSIN